jgi:hypothetical protein
MITSFYIVVAVVSRDSDSDDSDAAGGGSCSNCTIEVNAFTMMTSCSSIGGSSCCRLFGYNDLSSRSTNIDSTKLVNNCVTTDFVVVVLVDDGCVHVQCVTEVHRRRCTIMLWCCEWI